MWLLVHGIAGAAEPEVFELRNGLQVVLVPQPGAPSVVSNLTFALGSAHEPPELGGLAHLFEHLAFQGTVSSPTLLFDVVLPEGGGTNGSTAYDYTDYYVVMPPEKLPLALFLTSETLGWLVPAIREETLSSELGIVHNELRERYETPPAGPFAYLLCAAAFPAGHPYAHPGVGTHESLDRITLDDIRRFFETWYVPGNAQLVVTGDFDPAFAKREVRRYFGDIPRGPEVDLAIPAGPIAEDVSTALRRPGLQPSVLIAWQTPPDPASQERIDLLVGGPLGGAPGLRLHRALVETGLATSAGASSWPRVNGDLLMVSAGIAPGHTADEVVAAIDAVLEELASGESAAEGPVERELRDAAAQLDTDRRIQLQDPVARARAIQQAWVRTGDPFRDPAVVQDVTTPTEAAALLREILAGHRVVVELGSVPDEASGDVSEPAEVSP